ncbi:hypothetical protein JRQ81_011668 [Phrynocephalus forsythii]|uniref:NIDO domain-containing protein n=1 Tax=Phrynocephalus forsythii TaxID=171643 RepID=A0A9Q1AQ96_9SAUR|nr:hypothetical protein JRQ81_011668 [Phrynocephalus forsythii]
MAKRTYFSHKGILLSTLYSSEESVSFIENEFQFFDDDIVTVSYPKSGTNWMLEILGLIWHDGDPSWVQSIFSHERSPWIESVDGLEAALKYPPPRFLTTHLPFQLFPKDFLHSKCKVIYIMRNPKDVLVSHYHFAKFCEGLEEPGTWEEFLEKFLNGKVMFGSWFDHLKGWMKLKDRPNMFFISYEELQQDLRGNVERIGHFIGKELDGHQLDEVVKHASFQIMKDNKMSNFSLLPDMDHNKGKLLRKGEANMKISLSFLLILLARVLYPYGKAVGDQTTPKEDDGTSPRIRISEPFTFYGKKYNSVYVNNNGVVSFDTPVPEYTPEAIPLVNGKAFVAPFWGDVNNVEGGDIYYRQTKDPEVLAKINQDINRYYPDSHFKADWAFIATWDRVAYYGSESNKVNTFQATLANSPKASYMILNYGDIQWTTGAASDGNPLTGLGGIPAQAGFNSGDDKNYFSIPGSRTEAILKIEDTTNVDEPGRWVFQVDDFKVEGIPEEVLQKMKEEEEARRAEKAAKKAAEDAAKKAEEEAAKKAAEEAAKKAAEEAAKKAAEDAAKKAAEDAAKKAAEDAAKKAEEEAAKKAAEEAAKKVEEEAAKKAAEETAKKAAEAAAKKPEDFPKTTISPQRNFNRVELSKVPFRAETAG